MFLRSTYFQNAIDNNHFSLGNENFFVLKSDTLQSKDAIHVPFLDGKTHASDLYLETTNAFVRSEAQKERYAQITSPDGISNSINLEKFSKAVKQATGLSYTPSQLKQDCTLIDTTIDYRGTLRYHVHLNGTDHNFFLIAPVGDTHVRMYSYITPMEEQTFNLFKSIDQYGDGFEDTASMVDTQVAMDILNEDKAIATEAGGYSNNFVQFFAYVGKVIWAKILQLYERIKVIVIKIFRFIVSLGRRVDDKLANMKDTLESMSDEEFNQKIKAIAEKMDEKKVRYLEDKEVKAVADYMNTVKTKFEDYLNNGTLHNDTNFAGIKELQNDSSAVNGINPTTGAYLQNKSTNQNDYAPEHSVADLVSQFSTSINKSSFTGKFEEITKSANERIKNVDTLIQELSKTIKLSMPKQSKISDELDKLDRYREVNTDKSYSAYDQDNVSKFVYIVMTRCLNVIKMHAMGLVVGYNAFYKYVETEFGGLNSASTRVGLSNSEEFNNVIKDTKSFDNVEGYTVYNCGDVAKAYLSTDKEDLKQVGQSLSWMNQLINAFALKSDDMDQPIIIVTSGIVRWMLRENLKVVEYHELGHIQNNHLLKLENAIGAYRTGGKMNLLRKLIAASFRSVRHEIEADKVAAEHLGNQATLNALIQLKRIAGIPNSLKMTLTQARELHRIWAWNNDVNTRIAYFQRQVQKEKGEEAA